MFATMFNKYLSRIYCHWAIQVHGNVLRDCTRGFKQIYVIQKLLRTSYRKYWNKHYAFMLNCFIDNGRQFNFRVVFLMQSISVGGFKQ